MTDRTPENIGREAGQALADAIADGLDSIVERLTERIVAQGEELAQVRDELAHLATAHVKLDNAFRVHARAAERGEPDSSR